ncbi:hypothetical protein JAAARDRAFT_219284 [Jaapia argillacea MUCL 33604]|uniref:Spindle pole body component n=1 Tax=Jaapia argillacea MUCL 33604 TaxID=933084 RepID=A0A067QL10_9AGAM|nr:hypothetical protein JAAARDRAFT_219284 [Jaapia argillacea MUCL 33604]
MFPSSSSGALQRPKSRTSHTRPPSSSSLRPSSSAPIRPSSSASVRPPSSASTRPPSSASRRPPSSASTRPTSRTTIRPTSRQASSRLIPFYPTLITQVLGLHEHVEGGDEQTEEDEVRWRNAMEFVSESLSGHGTKSVGVDMDVMDKQIRGHAQKARINMRDKWAEALEVAYSKLKEHVKCQKDLDTEVKMARLPDHLQFLLMLSTPPTSQMLANASTYLERLKHPPPPPATLTWKEIIQDEPFEGDHWAGIFDEEEGSEDSELSDWGEERDRDIDTDTDFGFGLRGRGESVSSLDPEEVHPIPNHKNLEEERDPRRSWAHRQGVEEMKEGQYWRDEWVSDVDSRGERVFDIGDSSTLGPAMRRVLGEGLGAKIDGVVRERYINEVDAVREILIGLQGRKNLLIEWQSGGQQGSMFIPSPTSPRLVHLTLGSQHSIISSFARIATTVQHLRKFVEVVFELSRVYPTTKGAGERYAKSGRRHTKTLEAYAEAVDVELRTFDSWCAGREEQMLRASFGVVPEGEGKGLVASLLSLEKALRDEFGEVFGVLLDVTRRVMLRATSRSPLPPSSSTTAQTTDLYVLASLPTQQPPSHQTTYLLNVLLGCVSENMSMGDGRTADGVMRVFGRSVEVVWGWVGEWLWGGMEVSEPGLGPGFTGGGDGRGVDEEFFVEDNGFGIGDPEFWVEGLTLRGGDWDVYGRKEKGKKSVPVFLEGVAEDLLSGGKSMGLLRALELVGGVGEGRVWVSFQELLVRSCEEGGKVRGDGPRSGISSVSPDALSRLVFDELLPYCQTAQGRLTRVLCEECEMWRHLGAIEDIYLMRRGDEMSHFVDTLFAKMDTRQHWSDFHFLNSTFTDIVQSSTKKWVEPSLVRLSYRGNKDSSITRTVKAIDGLAIEYAAPFPLTYLFGGRAIGIYNSILVFLVQMRRAKSVLDRILVRGAIGGMGREGSELKMFYAMRSKLSWFINTLLDFVVTNVLHTQVLRFHEGLRKAKSLDEMIQLHDDHLEKLQGRCLLQDHTSALDRAVQSVLDMSLYFSDCFVAFAGDTTHDISRVSLVMTRRHRSRHQRRQRKNIIGFSQSLLELGDDDDSDSDSEHDDAPEPSFSLGASSISLAEEDFFVRLDKMGSELDGLVRFVRRGVESLAGGTNEAAQAFGVLAFALEDWDR